MAILLQIVSCVDCTKHAIYLCLFHIKLFAVIIIQNAIFQYDYAFLWYLYKACNMFITILLQIVSCVDCRYLQSMQFIYNRRRPVVSLYDSQRSWVQFWAGVGEYLLQVLFVHVPVMVARHYRHRTNPSGEL